MTDEIKYVGVGTHTDDLKAYSKVPAVHGITEESDLELTITSEGLIIDLYEVTEACNGSSCECTETFSATFEELLDLLK